jgi:hypothetical protein
MSGKRSTINFMRNSEETSMASPSSDNYAKRRMEMIREREREREGGGG